MKGRTVVVAMSGGVDSSVAAALLKEEGYRVIGVGLRLFDGGGEGARTCCGIRDMDDARRVAYQLDIPFYLLDLREIFKRRVIDYFLHGYLSGETPNPCVACNRWIKFQALFKRCSAWGADFLATGHYARLARAAGGAGFHVLLRGRDERKDQSYFLYMLRNEQLPRILFPVGDLTKEETRSLAAELGLKVHDKRESQDVCFIGDGDYASFLMAWHGGELRPGPVLDRKGQVIGSHRGLPLYTLGQRKGLKVDRPGPWYVAGMDRERNALIVSREPPRCREGRLREVNFVSGKAPGGPLEVSVMMRYRGREFRARVVPLSGGEARLEFMEPADAAAAGQAAVFYQGERVVGGGKVVNAGP